MNGFTKEQEAFMEKVAYKVGHEIARQIKEDRARDLQDAVRVHADACIALMTIKRLKILMIGIGIGCGLGGGGIGFAAGLIAFAHNVIP